MCVCWTFVCAGSVSEGVLAIERMFDVFNPWILFDGSLLTIGWTSTMHVIIVLLGSLFILYLDKLNYSNENLYIKLEKQNNGFQCVFWWGIIFVIMYFGVFGQSSFIYFQF